MVTKNVCLISTDYGRVIVTELAKPIDTKTHCLEIHRTTIQNENAVDVFFILLSREELAEVHEGISEILERKGV